MRVLYVINQLGRGGKERRLTELLKGFQGRDIETRVVLLENVVHYREIYDLETEVTVLERKLKKDPRVFLKLYRICRRWKPDIIHAWDSMSAVYSIPASRLLGIKLINAMIASAPGKLSPSQALRSFITFPFSDVIQSNSYAGLEAYSAPQGKSHVVHNCFNFDRVSSLKEKSGVRGELGVGTELVAGMVAGFHRYKDYVTLVRAAQKVLKLRDDVSFVCVGQGVDLPRIRDMAGFTERIIFPGMRSDVESVVNIFDVGILSTYGEGISNSIMEYMALGKPVVAAEGGGTTELVVDGETGFMVPRRSPQAMAEKILYLLDNPERRAEMGRAGRERIMEEFSPEKMVGRQLELYRRLCGFPQNLP